MAGNDRPLRFVPGSPYSRTPDSPSFSAVHCRVHALLGSHGCISFLSLPSCCSFNFQPCYSFKQTLPVFSFGTSFNISTLLSPIKSLSFVTITIRSLFDLSFSPSIICFSVSFPQRPLLFSANHSKVAIKTWKGTAC